MYEWLSEMFEIVNKPNSWVILGMRKHIKVLKLNIEILLSGINF
jgi:hypothetical protein